MRPPILSCVVVLAASPALACTAYPGEVYDDLPSASLAVAIAAVTEVSVYPKDGEGACIASSYERAETIHGEIGGTFRVEICGEDGAADDDGLGTGMEDYGFTKGATVLVGVIRTGPAPSDLRYAVPDCWGPFHIRLDTMTAEDREAVLADARALLAGK